MHLKKKTDRFRKLKAKNSGDKNGDNILQQLWAETILRGQRCSKQSGQQGDRMRHQIGRELIWICGDRNVVASTTQC